MTENARLDHVQTGGGQELGMRAGTHNVPGIVGLAKAYEITRLELKENVSRMVTLRDNVIEGVTSSIENAVLTGHPKQRLPNHASFVFEKVDGNTLLMLLDAGGFGCSSGSACKSGNPKPSEVLLAIGVNPQSALGSLRVTLGRETTLDEIERFLAYLPKVVEQARKLYVE